MNIPIELQTQLNKGDVSLFCGMDLSASVGGLPTTVQLAQELAKHAGIPNGDHLTLPEIAERYRLGSGLGYHSLINFIATRIDHPSYLSLPIHHMIASLPCQTIITTAWDTLLEIALRNAQRPYTNVIVDNDVSFISGEKVSLIKLRGSMERKETLVITGDDYYDVFLKRPQMANFVSHLFATKTMLFLGFDLRGDDFKRLYHSVIHNLDRYKRQAFAVQPNPDPYSVQYWREKGVAIIPAQSSTFLEALHGQYAPTVVSTSPSSLAIEEATTDLKRIDPIKLVEKLNSHFDKEELRTLCFQLDINYDDLPAEGRANKARELVIHLDQDSRLPELITLMKNLRPRANWETKSFDTRE